MYRSAATKKAHDDSIWTVEWSNADQIITGSVDQTCKVWDPKDLSEPVHTFGKHDLAIISAGIVLG